MDDNQFDDHIRKKVAAYEEPGFDPAALADLHYRMAAADSVWPWYSRYRTELIVGAGLALCTLLILWNQWTLNSRGSSLSSQDQSSKFREEQINKLQEEIIYLKHLKPDTIRIVESRDQNSTLYTILLNRIANLQADLQHYRNEQLQNQTIAIRDTLTTLTDFSNSDQQYINAPTRLIPRQEDSKSARAPWNELNTNVKAKQRSLSVKSMRDIEDHYQKGIGIRLGPTVEMSKGIYSLGKGHFDIAGGLLGDFILSPSLSIETGGKYVHRVYSISDQTDLASKTFPQVESGLGTPKNVDIDSWILEVPFNLKYRYPLSLKTHWLTGIGYSSMLFTRQILEYDYTLSGNSTASIYSVYKKERPEFYSGAINFSLGLSNETKRKNIIETSVYYQYGLGNIGAEATQRSFLGVRSVYWFKIK